MLSGSFFSYLKLNLRFMLLVFFLQPVLCSPTVIANDVRRHFYTPYSSSACILETSIKTTDANNMSFLETCNHSLGND